MIKKLATFVFFVLLLIGCTTQDQAQRNSFGGEFHFRPVVEAQLRVAEKHIMRLPGDLSRRDEGPVVTIRQPEGHLYLDILGIHNYALISDQGREQWKSRSADEIVQDYREAGFAMLPFERYGGYPIDRERFPLTVLLAGRGLLQVIDVMMTDSPIVAIRYKLVQSSVGTLPGHSEEAD